MVTFRHKGDFSKLTSFLVDVKETVRHVDLDKYGREAMEKTIGDAVSIYLD